MMNYFIPLCFLIVLLFWKTKRMHREFSSTTADILKKCEDLKKLLLDLRDGTKTYYEEKRKTERIKNCITIKIVSKDSIEFVKTLDLSRTGAHFRTKRKLTPGGLIDIIIYLSLFPQPIKIKARIARVCRTQEDTTLFDAGIEFLNMTEPDKEKLADTLRLLVES